MDRTTPASGLASSLVADCNCVVLHCNETGRTVLTHSPRWQAIPRYFEPMIQWLVDKAKTPVPLVEVVVLRGFSFAGLKPSARLLALHLDWFDEFTQFKATLSCKVNIVDELRLLLAGSVLVDKVTAKITIVDGNTIVQVENSSSQHYDRQAAVDALVTVVSMFKPPHEPLELHLQYNVTKYQLPRTLPFLARQLLRSKLIGENERKQMAFLKLAGFEHGIGTGNFRMV